MEQDPHQLIEGMILSAYAIQADQSFVFLRWAYHNAAHAIEEAIRSAFDRGHVGQPDHPGFRRRVVGDVRVAVDAPANGPRRAGPGLETGEAVRNQRATPGKC